GAGAGGGGGGGGGAGAGAGTPRARSTSGSPHREEACWGGPRPRQDCRTCAARPPRLGHGGAQAFLEAWEWAPTPTRGGCLHREKRIPDAHRRYWCYVVPILLKDHIPEIISSTRKSAERVSKQCRASVSPGPTRDNP
ncbi:unnamed protein product, partial [Prorocentrum cordatum]